MSNDGQSAETQFALLKDLFWATVFGAGEEQLSALLAEWKCWGTELEGIVSSCAALAEQAKAEASPAPQQQQQSRSMQVAEQGAEAALRSSEPAVQVISHETFQRQAAPPGLWDLALAPVRKQQQNISRDAAAIASPQDGAVQEPVQAGAESKPCKCKKSRCLKLYCDCFATGHYCNEACFCMDCQNRTSSKAFVFQARNFTLARDPTAFQPKVAAAHVKGCHCRKSRCLKKYCECYLGNVPCTDACRCMNCQNREPRADREAGVAEGVTLSVPIIEEDLLAAAPRRQQHLDPEVYLADPPLDSSASLEGASASQPGFVGAVPALSGTPSSEDSMEERAPAAAQPGPHELGRAAIARAQAALRAGDWAVAGQSAGDNATASLEDPSTADDATSPPPCVSRSLLSRSIAGGARAPIDPQRSINPTMVGAWRTWLAGEPEREEAAAEVQPHVDKRPRLGMRIQSVPSPQPTPDTQLPCAALQPKMDLMPAMWRPVLLEVHGNTTGRPMVPGSQKEAQ